MKVTVLKEGLSVEVKGETVHAKVGDVVDVSKEAFDYLVKNGWVKLGSHKLTEKSND